MNKIKDVLDGLHNFIMEMQLIEGVEDYNKATDEIIADALSEIKKIRLEELPKEREPGKHCPYTDNGYNQAITDIKEIIEKE